MSVKAIKRSQTKGQIEPGDEVPDGEVAPPLSARGRKTTVNQSFAQNIFYTPNESPQLKPMPTTLTLPGQASLQNSQTYAAVTPSETGTYLKREKRPDLDYEYAMGSTNGHQLNVDRKGDQTHNDDYQGGTPHTQTQNDEVSTKQQIEIQHGQPMRSLRSLKGMSNKLEIQRYKRSIYGLAMFIFDTFVTFDIFILLFHILLVALSQRDDEGWMIIYCVGAINLVGQSSINLLQDQKLKQAADSVNKLQCEKFVFNRRQKRFLRRPWEEIHVGDIIKVKSNNQVPADCLILDIKGYKDQNSDSVAYVKGGPNSNNSETLIKKSCQNTQIKTSGTRLSDSKFVQLLSGQIKWEYTTSGKYHGSLKLNDNPAAFEFKSEHVVNRGSSLYLTEQIICMVLNIGDECVSSVMRERTLRTPSIFTRLFKFKEVKYQRYYYGEMVHNIRILQLLSVAASFFSWFVIIFVYYIIGQTPLYKFEASIVENPFYVLSTAEQIPLVLQRIISLQSQYLLFYPYIVKIIIDFIAIFHNLFVVWDVNLIPSNISITNYFALNRLSQVSNMVLSPSTLLGYRQNVVLFQSGFKGTQKEFHNQNHKQFHSQHEAQVKLKEQAAKAQSQQNEAGYTVVQAPEQQASDDSSAGSDDEARLDLEYLPISRNNQFRFENQQVVELINKKDQKDAQHIQELLRACCICHSSVVREREKQQSTEESKTQANQRLNQDFKSIYKFDQAQLTFANSFKYGFVSRKGNMITISVQGKQELYEEIAMINVDLRGNPMTVQVIKAVNNQDGCTIIYKAPLQALKIFMREDLFAQIDNDLQNMTKQGVQALTFAKKELDSEYSADLYRLIVDVQTFQQGNQSKLQEVLMTQCEGLEMIGTLGIKPYFNQRNAMFMEEAHRNGIKIWLLSSQLEYENILQINAAQFLASCSQPLNVKGKNERQVEESLKASLKAASDRIQTQFERERDLVSKVTTTTRNQNASLNSKQNPKTTSGKDKENASRVNQSTSDKSQQAPLEVVFTNGFSLSIIMRDESLLKIFLILCQLCNCVVGSKVNATQKADLVKALKEFNVQANLGYVMSVIGNSSDMYTLNEADVKVGLIQKYRSSDNIALTDINMTELHALTYIMFKHATHLNRRLRAVINFFFYRTVLMFVVMTLFIILAELTPVLPFNVYFTMIFMHILTPVQYFLFGISHKDYGFDQFHRIFGEYRNNQFVSIFSGSKALSTVIKALIDAILLCFFSFVTQWELNLKPVIAVSGIVVSAEAYVCYNSIVLSLIQLKRMRDNNSNISFFQPFYYLCFFLSIIFVLEDDSLVGLSSLFQAPAMILQLVLIALLIFLQETVYKVFRNMIPSKQRDSMLFYKYVEEMIFMEEYEDNKQEFQIINNTAQTNQLLKQIKTRELVAINQNMLRLHRSDSMDQILERINLTGEQNQGTSDNKIVNRSTLVNKYLKLNDFNKELEYQNQPVDQRMLEPILYTLYCFVILFFCLIIGTAMANTEKVPNKIPIVIIQTALIVVSAGLVVVLKRFKDINHGRVLLLYVFVINLIANIEQSFAINDQTQVLSIYAVFVCSFLLRLKSYFTVVALCILSMICYCQLSFSNLLHRSDGSDGLTFWQTVESYFRILNILLFLLILILYAYWDETTKKISFVINFRKQKEFQKSKQILNILVPSIVRARIQEGQKNFSDAQGMVTIVFCDIEGFDDLVQLYEGKELIKLLDQTYNAFDQLCDQYGLQKVETVGKTYMACGGLKIVESKIDSRLLGNHFSVRVVDYAFEMLSVANSIKLKTGGKLKVKIGIHTGDVVTGVVGETKPQFSLIGDTVNKTSRVCSKCPSKQILISKETHKQLEIYSNNFTYESFEVFMKGIGTEKVYKVFKKGLKSGLLHSQPGHKLQSALKSKLFGSSQHLDQQLQRKQEIIQEKEKQKKEAADEQQYQELARTERTLNTENDRASDVASQSEGDDQVRKQFGKFKEDRVIVNNPALNIKYKLVERPRFLLQFNQKEQEQEFQQFISKFYLNETLWFLIIKACIDVVLIFTVGWRSHTDGSELMYYQFAWILPYIVLVAVLIRVLAVTILNKPNVVAYSICLVILYFFFAFAINTSQSIFDAEKQGVYTTCKLQLELYALVAFTLRAFQTRSIIVTHLFFAVSFAIHIFTDQRAETQIVGFAEIAAFVCFLSMLAINSYFREMAQRKQYNNERIIDIEIEKTEDLLSKLVPFHVLSGIKNDQRVVDVLDNVTLLYTDMVGFTQFSNNVKNPVEVVQLLSKLFSKFDQLTDAHSVYKVHTIGDCYVIMGYTGKTPKYRRTTAVQIEEAYRVVKVGLEMIEIIREVREQSSDPNLKSLDMRIGIHTGKIVGGIIGTKVVRYDIFGQDVLIANKMESNGQSGTVCISGETLALLKQNQFIMDTLDFTEHTSFEIGNIGRKIQSYIVEQIFMDNSVGSSSEFSSHQFDSNDEEEKENSSDSESSGKQDDGFVQMKPKPYSIPQQQQRQKVEGDKYIDPSE